MFPQYTPKYLAAKEMIAEYDPLYSLLAHPEMPEIQSPKVKLRLDIY